MCQNKQQGRNKMLSQRLSIVQRLRSYPPLRRSRQQLWVRGWTIAYPFTVLGPQIQSLLCFRVKFLVKKAPWVYGQLWKQMLQYFFCFEYEKQQFSFKSWNFVKYIRINVDSQFQWRKKLQKWGRTKKCGKSIYCGHYLSLKSTNMGMLPLKMQRCGHGLSALHRHWKEIWEHNLLSIWAWKLWPCCAQMNGKIYVEAANNG